MKFLTIIPAFLLLISTAHAQPEPIKFGNASLAEVQMTKYEKDTSAAAVILIDYGRSTLPYNSQKGFTVLFERVTRIKILKKEGLEWGDFSIPLYKSGNSGETATNIKGITYNYENGTVVETKLKNENIFKEAVSKNKDVVKVAFPNVKVGSVIEFTYKVSSDFTTYFQGWEFQHTIPVVYSEYRARIPEWFGYDKYAQGYIPFVINESTVTSSNIMLTERVVSSSGQPRHETEKIDLQEKSFRWAAKDVPAFKAEPFITSESDYISKISFELAYTQFPNAIRKNYLGDWADINKIFADDADFLGQVKGNVFLKKLVDEIIAGVNTDEAKVATIDLWVKKNILWDGSYTYFIRSSMRKVFDDKKGSTGEINLLLASMLDKAGLTVYPVLISTRAHGMLKEHIPSADQFNNVLCHVEATGKQYLLDATDPYLPTSTLPESCLNGKGFVVSKSGYKWVSLAPPRKTLKVVNGVMKLSAEGSLTGDLTIERSGYTGYRARKSYFSDGEAKYITAAKQEHWEVRKSEFKNVKEFHETFKEIHEITIPEFATAAGEMIYINPTIDKYSRTNPFKLEKREYPVDFAYPADDYYMIKIEIPDGYEIEQIPTSKALALPGNASRFSYNVSAFGNFVTIVSSVTITKTMFGIEEYPNLREFYNQIIAKQDEQIVLKKKH